MAMTAMLAVVAFVLWWRRSTRAHLIEDLPTTAVAGVVPGLNEITGIARAATPTTAPISDRPCVYWEHETYTKDGRGRKRKVGKKKTGGSGVFWLTDETASIRVYPTQAEIIPEQVYDGIELTHASDASLAERRALSKNKHYVTERIVPEEASLYILGPARPAPDSLDLQIGRDVDGNDPLIISTISEARLLSKLKWFARLMLFGSLVFTLVVAALWAQGEFLVEQMRSESPTMGVGDIEWLPLLTAMWFWGLAVGAVALVLRYNGLIALRERAERAWSLIDVELRRRHDLLPELERIVKANAAQEHEVHTALADLRSIASHELPTQLDDASVTEVDLLVIRELASMNILFGLTEQHPALGADESYCHLRDQFVDTENRISRARHFYNLSVNALHDRAQTHPSAWIAWLFELDLEAQFASDRTSEVRPAPAHGSLQKPHPA